MPPSLPVEQTLIFSASTQKATYLMSQLTICRTHTLCPAAARDLASQWVKQAETDYQMSCVCEPVPVEAPGIERWSFARPGVSGTLTVSPECFELDMQLGFLLGAFKDRIASEIEGKLDRLLGPSTQLPP